MLSNQGCLCQCCLENISVKLCRFAQRLQHVYRTFRSDPTSDLILGLYQSRRNVIPVCAGETAGLDVSPRRPWVRHLTHSGGMQWNIHILLQEHCRLLKLTEEHITDRIPHVVSSVPRFPRSFFYSLVFPTHLNKTFSIIPSKPKSEIYYCTQHPRYSVLYPTHLIQVFSTVPNTLDMQYCTLHNWFNFLVLYPTP